MVPKCVVTNGRSGRASRRDNMVSCGATMSASEKGSEWERAARFLQRMAEKSLAPSDLPVLCHTSIFFWYGSP